MNKSNAVTTNIEDKIYEIRGELVILDFDIAKLYQYTNGTKAINLVVKRHADLFPNKCYFQLTNEEYSNLRFQTETAKLTKSRTLPYAFTADGIATLSTVLRSENSKKISQIILLTFNSIKSQSLSDAPKIKDLIYEIGREQVMIDNDLARLYEVETRRINEAVTRNKNKFPERFSWTLTDSEFENLRSQIATSSWKNNYGGRRYDIRVFTEQGVAMLATILKSKTAVEVSIQIMDAFVAMRRYISSGLIQQKYINDLVIKDNKRIDLLEETFSKFEKKKAETEIYFNGQIYDAYFKIQEIFNQAESKLIIIDAYADNTILDIIKRLKVEITIITKPNNLLTNQDVEKYNKQYKNLTVKYDNTFHDRYFILDDNIVYHCGTSINRIGYKTFSITLVGDEDLCKALNNKVRTIL